MLFMTQKTHSDIWVLTDNRTGNSVQAIAVAENLGQNFEIKRLEYNIFANLPNFLLGSSCFYITKKTKESLKTDHPPKLIITSGRRTAGIAVCLKKYYKDVKLAQIMKPDMPSRLFDLIILPQHDTFKDSGGNVLRTIGAINNIPNRIAKLDSDFATKHPTMINFIGVLVGGNTKEYKFGPKDAEEFATILENVHGGIPLLITFSRRTPDVIKNLFKAKFQWPHMLYDPTISDADNPYLDILKNAKFLVLTCDSVSMCSEAASSGKPLYIYIPERFASKKHRYFTQQLVDLGIARIISTETASLEEYYYPHLNEIKKVAESVVKLL